MRRPGFVMSAALVSLAWLAGGSLAWAETTDGHSAQSAAKPAAKAQTKAKSDKKVKAEKSNVTTNTVPQTQALAPRDTPVAHADEGKSKPVVTAVREAPVAVPTTTPAPAPAAIPARAANPYLGTPYLPNAAPAQAGTFNSATPVSNPLKGLADLLPSRPEGSSLLPSITTVYPTGEKPLKVVTFKCPTEMLGVTPPPMKLLHEAVNLGMDGINRTNLLSFNLQQVCQ